MEFSGSNAYVLLALLAAVLVPLALSLLSTGSKKRPTALDPSKKVGSSKCLLCPLYVVTTLHTRWSSCWSPRRRCRTTLSGSASPCRRARTIILIFGTIQFKEAYPLRNRARTTFWGCPSDSTLSCHTLTPEERRCRGSTHRLGE